MRSLNLVRFNFSKIITLLEILLVLPATNAVCERSETTLHRIKNWLRTSITLGRINHCMLLAFYKEMTDKLYLIDVANEFGFGCDEGSDHFGRFC